MEKPRNNFDALRLTAALAVMFSHVHALTGRPEPGLGGLTLGTIAVFVFFAISGYLVSSSWRSDPDVQRFVARRLLRVAPAYIVVIAVTSITMTSLGLTSFTMNPLGAVNGSLWTIDYEVLCYLVFMVLAVATRHGGLALVTMGAALGFDSYFEQFATIFGLGATISQYGVLQRRWSLPLIAAIAIAVFPLRPSFLPIAVFVTAASVWLGSQSWPGVRDFGARGDLSYGVYLYAYPVQQLTIMLLGTSAPLPGLLLIAVVWTAAMAWLSWRFVEEPALALKAFLPRGAQRPEAANSAAMLSSESAVGK